METSENTSVYDYYEKTFSDNLTAEVREAIKVLKIFAIGQLLPTWSEVKILQAMNNSDFKIEIKVMPDLPNSMTIWEG